MRYGGSSSGQRLYYVACSLHASQMSTRALAAQYDLNSKTVAKWCAQKTAADAATGPREPRSTVLSLAEEAVIVEFRRRAPS